MDKEQLLIETAQPCNFVLHTECVHQPPPLQYLTDFKVGRSDIFLERGIPERRWFFIFWEPVEETNADKLYPYHIPEAVGAIYWSRSATQGNSTEKHINLTGHFGAWNDNLLVRSRKGAGLTHRVEGIQRMTEKRD